MIVGLALAAAAIIAVVDGSDVFGVFAANDHDERWPSARARGAAARRRCCRGRRAAREVVAEDRDRRFERTAASTRAGAATTHAAAAALVSIGGMEAATAAPFSLELSQDQRDIRDWVHGFAEQVVRPAAAEWDEREETPWPIIAEAAKIGLYGYEALAQFYADETGLTLPIVNEELFWGDAGIGMAIMGTSLAVAAIFGQGTGEQIGEWIPQCFGTEAEPAVAAFCVSEPDAGSDVSSLRTRAVYDEAAGEWVLNGQKAWATNGGIAGVHVVVASVDRDLGARGQAAFVIPPGTPRPHHGRQGAQARPARLPHRRRVPRRLPRPRLVPAGRQGEARRAAGPRARGDDLARPGRDADVRGDAARRSARRRSASRAPRTSTRWTTRASASSSGARSSTTRRSPSCSPT